MTTSFKRRFFTFPSPSHRHTLVWNLSQLFGHFNWQMEYWWHIWEGVPNDQPWALERNDWVVDCRERRTARQPLERKTKQHSKLTKIVDVITQWYGRGIRLGGLQTGPIRSLVRGEQRMFIVLFELYSSDEPRAGTWTVLKIKIADSIFAMKRLNVYKWYSLTESVKPNLRGSAEYVESVRQLKCEKNLNVPEPCRHYCPPQNRYQQANPQFAMEQPYSLTHELSQPIHTPPN